MLFALGICVDKKAPPTDSVNLPPVLKKNHPFYFGKLLLNLQTMQVSLFRQFPLNILVFHTPP